MHALTRWVGFRVDARYLHAFVDETATGGGHFKDYGFWRVSVGVVFGNVGNVCNVGSDEK